MIGLDFTIPNEWGSFLAKILDGVNTKNGIWKLAEEEVFVKDGYLFDKTTYNDEEFNKLINSNEYYVTFINVQLYSDYEDKEIKNYSDYENSKCILVLSIIDNIHGQIYSKDLALLEQIKENLIKNNFQNIRIITKDSELKKLFPTYND